MNLKKIVIIIFIYILNLNNLHAIEPDVFVQSTVNRASHKFYQKIFLKKKK